MCCVCGDGGLELGLGGCQFFDLCGRGLVDFLHGGEAGRLRDGEGVNLGCVC